MAVAIQRASLRKSMLKLQKVVQIMRVRRLSQKLQSPDALVTPSPVESPHLAIIIKGPSVRE